MEPPVTQLPLPSDQALPSSRNGRAPSQARFGNLSHHAFFTRHSPHPSRVRHIKGLLDHPICYVDDKDQVPTPRTFYAFPPNSWNESQLRAYRMPISSVNLGTGYMPIDTLTGLQRFTGLQNYPYKEKAVPHIGIVPVTEGWRDELRQLTRNIALGRNLLEAAPTQRNQTPQSPRKTQYSSTTGRLIPASRNGTGKPKKYNLGAELDRVIEESDMETKVFHMICQLLQADDINSVKSWLMSAGDREKAIVTDLLHHALASHGDLPHGHYQAPPPRPPVVDDQNQTGEKNVERLTVADGQVTRETIPAGAGKTEPRETGGFLPPISDEPARPSTQRLQVFSRQGQSKSRDGRATARKEKECKAAEPQMWNPSQSVAPQE